MAKGITLEQLLASRENRWRKQKAMIQEHPGLQLVCLTVIMPGNIKRNAQSLIVAKAAVEALKEQFDGFICQMEENDLPTGYEAYMLTQLTVNEAKIKACKIEDTHPLGRLFDIDVIDCDTSPVGRESIGLPPRRCLLCNHPARFCMRNHSHTQEELLCKIEQMISDYVQRP